MNKKEKIFLASDHAAFKLKDFIAKFLSDLGYQVEDLGTYSEESTDYPKYAKTLVTKVLNGKTKGILLCGTGIGMSITANRFKGIRAALCHNEEFARLSREHNDSNVLVLPGKYLTEDESKKILNSWLNSKFQGERHERRINQIDNDMINDTTANI